MATVVRKQFNCRLDVRFITDVKGDAKKLNKSLDSTAEQIFKHFYSLPKSMREALLLHAKKKIGGKRI